MSPDLVLWCGPVYGPGSSPYAGGDIGNVTWQGPKPEIVTVSGSGSDYFSGLAEQYRDGAGRILPNLLASRGYSIDQFQQIAVAGFSAGHGLMNKMAGADADSIDAILALDACFETPGSNKPGYEGFASLAAQGQRLMVFTGSAGQNAPPLPPTTKGYECAEHAANDGAAMAGTQLVQVATPAGMDEPACGTWNAGNLWVLSYCDRLHDAMINQIGTATLQTFLAPYFASAPADAHPGTPHAGAPGQSVFPTWAKVALGLLAVGGAGAAGIALARRR